MQFLLVRRLDRAALGETGFATPCQRADRSQSRPSRVGRTSGSCLLRAQSARESIRATLQLRRLRLESGLRRCPGGSIASSTTTRTSCLTGESAEAGGGSGEQRAPGDRDEWGRIQTRPNRKYKLTIHHDQTRDSRRPNVAMQLAAREKTTAFRKRAESMGFKYPVEVSAVKSGPT